MPVQNVVATNESTVILSVCARVFARDTGVWTDEVISFFESPIEDWGGFVALASQAPISFGYRARFPAAMFNVK